MDDKLENAFLCIYEHCNIDGSGKNNMFNHLTFTCDTWRLKVSKNIYKMDSACRGEHELT